MKEKGISGYSSNVAFYNKVPDDLIFDDDPLEHMLYGTKENTATPVNLLAQWQSDGEEGVPFDAVTAVLANRPELIRNMDDLEKTELYLWDALESAQTAEHCEQVADCIVVLSAVFQMTSRLPAAVKLHQQAVEIWKEIGGPNHEKTLKTSSELIDMLETINQKEEAERIRQGYEVDRLFAKGDQRSLLNIRNLAYKIYEQGNFNEAERIYRQLIEKRFELPGTLSHLARTLLTMPLQDRRQEARTILENAWSERRYAPGYVPPRILLWEILLNILSGKDSSRTIGMLKYALQAGDDDTFWDYITLPVLKRWETSLSIENYKFLEALGCALSSRKNLTEIEKHPIWRKQAPVAFDASENIVSNVEENDSYELDFSLVI